MYEPFYIKSGNSYVQIIFPEILYIEAKDKTSKVFTTKEEYLICLPLGALEKILPSRYFFRINRSQIISLLHTKKFTNTHAMVSDKMLRISKQYREAIFNRVLMSRLDPKSYIILSDYDTLNLLRKIGPN